ncbi:hypothetical protein H0H92_011612 [Tricholoma furcatifolium]|nr:hypothetical protein H0H92_011612 [Tricholoma furcatifolium]
MINWRALSAFNHAARRWAPLPLRDATTNRLSPTQSLSLISWNIDAFSSRPVARAKLILNHVLEGLNSPDIIFLQEVSSDIRTSILNEARVRSAFLVTDAEDQTSFEDVPFSSMTLLSSTRFASSPILKKESDEIKGDEALMVRRVARVPLPSKYKRDALYIDIIFPTAPSTVFRLTNVHLDSLGDTLHYRQQQMKILANILREPGCSGGVIAGDFNAISAEDNALLGENGLVDAWVALHGGADSSTGPDGATWGVGVKRQDGLGPRRLDKVAMMGLVKAEKMEVLRPGTIEVPRPGQTSLEVPWSDHFGLRCWQAP